MLKVKKEILVEAVVTSLSGECILGKRKTKETF